jgi:hypothetical protein
LLKFIFKELVIVLEHPTFSINFNTLAGRFSTLVLYMTRVLTLIQENTGETRGMTQTNREALLDASKESSL